MSKIAVLFPGIGYTCDKPLLYYSAKLAAEKGFEVVRVPYGNFPSNVKGNAEKMYQSFVSAREQSEDILKDVDWSSYEEIVFFSKSVGTVVALSYASEHGIDARQVWQPTPVFLPGESQGRGSLVGFRLWGRTESDTTEAT